MCASRSSAPSRGLWAKAAVTAAAANASQTPDDRGPGPVTNPGHRRAPAPSTLRGGSDGAAVHCEAGSPRPRRPPVGPASQHTAHPRLQAPPGPSRGGSRGRRLRVCTRVHVPTRTSHPNARWLGNAHSEGSTLSGSSTTADNTHRAPRTRAPWRSQDPGHGPQALHRCPVPLPRTGPAGGHLSPGRSPGLTRARGPLLTPRADGVHAPA